MYNFERLSQCNAGGILLEYYSGRTASVSTFWTHFVVKSIHVVAMVDVLASGASEKTGKLRLQLARSQT